jgi:hypothetical protein
MLCALRKHPRLRILFALSAGIFASCLLAAPEDLLAAPEDDAGLHACADLGGPSNFDYVVLASLADSPHLLAMASFRAAASRQKDLGPCQRVIEVRRKDPGHPNSL